MRKKTLSSIVIAALLLSTVLLTGCGEYNYALEDYITLGKYEGIEIASSEIDAELDYSIEAFLEQNAEEVEVTERASKEGDTVVIDYEGKIDGELFAGGSEEAYYLKLGSGQFIEGFESGLVGKNAGDEVTLNLKFPDDYDGADVAGKDVVFDVKINSITERIVPEFTDEFIAKATSYATKEEYKAAKREIIKQNMLWSTVSAQTTVKQYPKKEVKKYYDSMIKNYELTAASYGMGIESYVNYFIGADMDTFATAMIEQAKAYTLNDMIAIKIANEKNIKLTDAEYNRIAALFAAENGYDDVKALENTSGKETVKKNARVQIVIEWVAANSIENTVEA